MTLGELIEILSSAENKIVPVGFLNPRSYRGYYDNLAFEPAEDVSVSQMLDAAKSALGKTFTGYKGGEYLMTKETECYIANYGCCGEELGLLTISLMLDDLDIWRNRR